MNFFDILAAAVESVVNAVVEVVNDVCETVGNAIEDGASAFAAWLGQIPVIGGVLSVVCLWVGNVLAGLMSFVAALTTFVISAAGALIGGLVRIIGGILTLDGGLIVKGFVGIFSGVVGPLIGVGTTLLDLGQRIIPVQEFDRRLTPEEEDWLRLIFGKSLALYNIRVVEGRNGVYSWADEQAGRPGGGTTTGNVIHLRGNSVNNISTLIHEAVHVWQYQHYGYQYLAEAIGAQWWGPGNHHGYDWGAEVAAGVTKWENFNREGQAEFIQNIYDEGKLTEQNGPFVVGDGVFFQSFRDNPPPMGVGPGIWPKRSFISDGMQNPDPNVPELDHSALADATLFYIQGRINVRPSQFL